RQLRESEFVREVQRRVADLLGRRRVLNKGRTAKLRQNSHDRQMPVHGKRQLEIWLIRDISRLAELPGLERAQRNSVYPIVQAGAPEEAPLRCRGDSRSELQPHTR